MHKIYNLGVRLIKRCKSVLIGDLGEAKAVFEFTKLEIPVLIPTSTNLPYDLAIDYDGKLYKVQAKTITSTLNGEMAFEICKSNAFKYERYNYTEDEVDLFFLYCLERDECYLLRIADLEGCRSISLRFEEPANGQKPRIRLAEDYTLEKTLEKLSKMNKI